jgi:type IV pilus assembly protein PilB
MSQPDPAHGEPTPRELAESLHLPFVDLRVERVEKSAAAAIPLRLLERAVAVPYRLEGTRLKVAMADPRNVQLIDELQLATSYSVEVSVAPRDDIAAELRRLVRRGEFQARAAADDDGDELPQTDAAIEVEEVEDDGSADSSATKLVNSIILQAATEGGSDVHFMPQADALVTRMRVDGVMQEIERIPKRHAAGVVSRIKVMAKLDIAEHRKPQDGRISLRATAAKRLLDIRVSILPTVEGEGVILRILDKSRQAPSLTDLGLSNEMQMQLETVITRPTGAVLVTGPTGSGKSTTLFAAVEDIRRPEINVITVEDPVEYRLADVYQLQVHRRGGLTFASALRAILRSDPDVVVVGEIRDLETAKISLEMALTGHLVLSTLHTNDAPSGITRLNDMGLEPFVTGSALSAVLAQRLVRRLCLECRAPYTPDAEELRTLGLPADDLAKDVTLYAKRGCRHCNRGYKGRIGVYQLMIMDDELRELASRGASRNELERAASAAGMSTLWQDGATKVLAGLTTIDELRRQLA